MVFAGATGVETRSLCWTGLNGAASARFPWLYPWWCYYLVSLLDRPERRLDGRIRIGCVFKLGCRTLGHGALRIHSE